MSERILSLAAVSMSVRASVRGSVAVVIEVVERLLKGGDDSLPGDLEVF